jgi:hypothetical protein
MFRHERPGGEEKVGKVYDMGVVSGT